MDLDAFLEERRKRPFEYFAHDCAHLAADWVLDQTGADPLEPLRSDVLAGKNLLTALRFVRKCGGFVQAGEKLLGPSLPGLMAQRGDVVLMRSGRKPGLVSGYSFGVATGTHLVGPGARELEFLPVIEAVAAWRLGDIGPVWLPPANPVPPEIVDLRTPLDHGRIEAPVARWPSHPLGAVVERVAVVATLEESPT